MELLLRSDDFEGAAYFLQQSIEKYLKAWLIERELTLKKTHELPVLLAEACTIDSSLAAHESICEQVAGYYFSQRYPTLTDTELSRSDVERDISLAELLLRDLFPDTHE